MFVEEPDSLPLVGIVAVSLSSRRQTPFALQRRHMGKKRPSLWSTEWDTISKTYNSTITWSGPRWRHSLCLAPRRNFKYGRRKPPLWRHSLKITTLLLVFIQGVFHREGKVSSEHRHQNQSDRISELVNTPAISESHICAMIGGWEVVRLWHVSARWACNGQNWAFNWQVVAFISWPRFFPRIQEIQTCILDILVPLCLIPVCTCTKRTHVSN